MKPIAIIVATAALPFARPSAHGQSPTPPPPVVAPLPPTAPGRAISAPGAVPPPPAPAAIDAPALAAAAADSRNEARFDIELEGNLPAQEAIEMVSKRVGHPINIVWSGDSAATALPSLRLHQVTLSEFFAAITAAGRHEHDQGRPAYYFTEVPDAPNVYTFNVVQPPASPSSVARRQIALSPDINLNVAGQLANIPKTTSTTTPKLSQFFDLSTLLNEKLTIEDITTAIRTAWTAAAGGDEPPVDALKYHTETQLLIATGQPERLESVDHIITLLKARNQPSREEKDREIARLQRELKEIVEDRHRLTSRLDQAESENNAAVAKLRERIAELEIQLAKKGRTF